MNTTIHSRDCSGQSTDAIADCAAIRDLDGRPPSDGSLLHSGSGERLSRDDFDVSSCPFGFHSGSIPLAGVGTIPSVATMPIDEIEKLRQELEQLREEQDQLRDRVDDLEDQNGQLEQENEELQDRVTELEDDKEQLQEANEDLRERVEALEDQPDIEIDDENDPIATLTIGNAPVGHVLTAKADKSDVEWCEEELEDLQADNTGSNPTPEAGEPTGHPAELTHIEKISRAAGDDISSVTDSVDARRAIALWRNLVQWGKKTPKGYCLRPADNPVSLLEADQDEDLCWKQYYRACEALEGLSEGAVTFCHSDRHGKMLVLHEQSEACERAKASLTPSSARAEG